MRGRSIAPHQHAPRTDKLWPLGTPMQRIQSGYTIHHHLTRFRITRPHQRDTDRCCTDARALRQPPHPLRASAGLARPSATQNQPGRPIWPAAGFVRRQLGIMCPGRPVGPCEFKLTPVQAFQCRFHLCTSGTVQKCVPQGPDAVSFHLLPCVHPDHHTSEPSCSAHVRAPRLSR